MQQVFSHSSLSCYEKCPKQYHFRYIERRPVPSESVEAFLGKRVHEVLERLHLFVDEGRIPSLRRVLERYRANWQEQWDGERIRVVHADLGAAWYLDAGARALENYYRRFYPFDASETVGIEKRIEFALDAPGDYRVRGVIDRLARAADGVLEVHDYKTGRRIPQQAMLDRDRQLALYELGVRETLGERGAVRLVWHYLLPDQTRVSTRTPEQLAALRAETCGAIDRVRAEREWAPRPSPLCAWCEFRDACPAAGGGSAEVAAATASPPPDDPPLLPFWLEENGQWRML